MKNIFLFLHFTGWIVSISVFKTFVTYDKLLHQYVDLVFVF